RILRGLVGLLDLAEDLRLADHHRLQAGRHAEGVTDGFRIRVTVEDRVQLAAVARVIAGEEGLQGLYRARIVLAGVELHAVAGGEDHGLARPRLRAQAQERVAHLVLGEGEGLAHGERGRPVAHADDDDHGVRAATGRANTFIQTNVNATAVKAAMPRRAARRPPHPVRWRA